MTAGGGTTVRGLRMIKGQDHRHPGGTGMTRLTDLGGHGMSSGLNRTRPAGGMTAGGGTGIRGLIVRERRDQWQPRRRGMTQLTLIRGQGMRLTLTGRPATRAIMTATGGT